MSSEKKRKVWLFKMRRRFVIGLFFSVLLFSILVFGTGYILEKQGYSIEAIRHQGAGVVILSAACAVIVSAASYVMIRRMFISLEKLDDAAQKIAKGEYNVRIEYDGHIEEISRTIDSFNKMAQELNSVEMIRNDFVANVSHEFKTPLASITGYVTLLQDPELTEEERSEYIRKTFFNIEKLGDLTENILRLSKVENQTYLDPPVSFRLDEQIREALVLLERKWSAKQTELDLHLPEVTYFGQKALLLQVWMNLISNAVKFSDIGGGITIKLKETGHHVQVFVIDEGIGMDAETLEHIFDKFYQGDTSRRSQGNGLGLALCKEILNRLGGKIFVTSEPGEGSVFMVQLPKNK